MVALSNKITRHLVGLSILCYLLIFLKLDSFHIRWWDESMFAVNDYEMISHNSFFVPYFDGQPDNFNTKPLLTQWIQIAFIRLLGYNELAIRLPSALAATSSVFLLFCFLFRYDKMWAWVSALVLLSSWGFINFHTARTGDSDSLLSFFLLAANLKFLDFIESNRNKNIFYFFVFISLAFLTKLFAGLLFIPGYIVILILQRKIRIFFLNKWFVSGLVIFMVLATIPLYLRELDAPGYLKEIFFKDAGRIFSVVENHREDGLFYLKNFVFTRFSFWFFLFVVGALLTLFFSGGEKIFLKNMLILIAGYFLMITISITKLEWYDMPLFPLMAIISGFAIFWILEKAFSNMKMKVLATCIIFIYPFFLMFDKSQGNTIPNGEKKLEASESFLFKRIKEHQNLNGLKVLHQGYKGSLLFYKYKLADVNQKIEITTKWDFEINDMVLVSDDSLKSLVKQRYEVQTEDREDYAEELRILEVKK